MIVDFHTHQPHGHDAVTEIISVDPQDFNPQPGRLYSVGIHPWHTREATDAHVELLARCAAHEQVVAIGETGLDPLQGAPLDVQWRYLQQHIALAEQLGKPLVLHMVRTSGQLLQAWKGSRRSVPWVLHGFRGRPTVARPLVEAGFYFSIGARFNAQSLSFIPLDHLLIETDDAPVTIATVASQVAQALGTTTAQVASITARNATALLHLGDGQL